MNIIEQLMDFNLTRQEATIYMSLSVNGRMTGYEVAKITGISRSSTYTTLASLVEKGAAYVVEDTAAHYTAVPVEEFCENIIRNLQKTKQNLINNMPAEQEEIEGYITIKGKNNILNKIKNMILNAEKRIYVSLSGKSLDSIIPQLNETISKGLKVVIITNPPFELPGAIVYHAEKTQYQIRLIVDSTRVLTGDIMNGNNSTCLYSKKQNLVDLFKESLKNEIKLIELTEGNET